MAIRVYRYELYDRDSRSFVRQIRYATERSIMAQGGVVMYSTAKEVAEDEILADGSLPPVPVVP